MPYKQIPKNRPIATLVKWYADKKSGKVSDSRKEIQKRFDYLDWKDQKRILLLFLQAGKSDRIWAYSKIYRQWDDCFLEPMKTLWEEHHEDTCAWSVIEHFPIEYVMANATELEETNGYYHLCQRLASNPSYVIDKTKLHDKEYLLVMLNSHREVTEEEAKDIFFNSLHTICLIDPDYLYNVHQKGRNSAFSVEDIDSMSDLMWLFHLLGLEHLRESIWQWNQDVMFAMYQSDEFKALKNEVIDDEEYNKKRLAIGLKYLYLALDKKYRCETDKPIIDQLFAKVERQSTKEVWHKSKKPISSPMTEEQRRESAAMLEQMKAENPVIAKLINTMGLEDEKDLLSEELPF